MSLDADERTLYVANLHKNVTEDILYELFLQAGPIERVRIPSVNSKNFRYGFVTYIHQCAIDYAIQLYKGTCLFKKELLIKRKGEKGGYDQQVNNVDRYVNEGVNDQDVIQNQTKNFGQSYLFDYQQIDRDRTVDNYDPYLRNGHGSNLMQSSLKGHWSDRSKPYDRNSRRHYSSRSNNERNRHRNRSNSDYDKSYRDRKGRY